jgi:hypothetical protein
LDWAARHKFVCNEAAESRKNLQTMGAFFQKISDASLTEDSASSESNSFGSFLSSLNSPEVASRISNRRSDLKKEKLRAPGTEAPNPDSWYMPASKAPSLDCTLFPHQVGCNSSQSCFPNRFEWPALRHHWLFFRGQRTLAGSIR